mgnify:CR=1 FL=1|jgi:ribonuclease Z
MIKFIKQPFLRLSVILIGLGLSSVPLMAGSYEQNLQEGAKTTTHNFMNDPFIDPVIANISLPETWPVYYNRGAIDRSPKNKSSKLLTMGTGTPIPNTYRYGPAMAVIVNGYPYFVDCGEGWFRALNRSAISQKGVDLTKVFKFNNLKYMFLTHLHEDHTVGLPSFILGPYKFGSKTNKVIFGPKGTEHLVNHIIEGWHIDRQEMVQGSTHQSPEGGGAVVGDIDPKVEFPGAIYEDKNVIVEAFRTKHGALRYTVAYRFTTKPDNRVIVFGGDGHYSKGLVAAAKDADILVIEGITFKNLNYSPWGGKTLAEKQKVIGAYHMFPKDLKKVQDESGVKSIVMVHEQNFNSAKDFSRLGLLHEMQKAGVKNIYSAMDGDLY